MARTCRRWEQSGAPKLAALQLHDLPSGETKCMSPGVDLLGILTASPVCSSCWYAVVTRNHPSESCPGASDRSRDFCLSEQSIAALCSTCQQYAASICRMCLHGVAFGTDMQHLVKGVLTMLTLRCYPPVMAKERERFAA